MKTGVVGKTAFAAVLLLTFVLVGPGYAKHHHKPEKIDFMLTILHNNDGESQLLNSGSGLEDFGGVARFKTVVDQLKKEARRGHVPRIAQRICKKPWFKKRHADFCERIQNRSKSGVIMVSSGDNFLAGPEFNASLEKGIPYYDTIAMDLIGYDAVAIGNHDFDFGPDVLVNFIEGYTSSVPYLSSNLDFSKEPGLQGLVDQGRIAASTVVRERGELIGIIGATTPNLSFISSPRNVEVNNDVAGAVQAEVDKLEEMGINKIVLISHLQSIEEDLDLAKELDGVDIMIAGGGDELLANEGDLLISDEEPYGPYPLMATDSNGTDIPVVTTQGSYGYVGRLVVGFNRKGDVVLIDKEHSGPVRVAGGDNPDAVSDDEEMVSLVTEPIAAALESLDANVIAESTTALNGLKPEVRTRETNEGNLIADALLWQAQQLAEAFGVTSPQVALQNGGGIRNASVIPAGDLTELDTFDMLPFSNFVTTVEDIPRAQFKEILENAVSKVETVSGRFAQVSGFNFTWRQSGTAQVLEAEDENRIGEVITAGTRIVDVTLNDGTAIVVAGEVVDGPPLSIATIDFLAKGGDQYPYRDAEFTRMGVTYQQALASFITDELSGYVDYPETEGRIVQLD